MFMFKIRRKSTDLLFEQNVKKVSFWDMKAYLPKYAKKKLKVNCLSSVKMDRIFDRVFMDNFVEKRNVIFLNK